VYRVYVGACRGALVLAEQFCAVANKKGDAAARPIGDYLTGMALHYLGDHANARRHLERVPSQNVGSVPRLRIDPANHDLAARSVLSRVLWMQGFPDQAVRSAKIGHVRAGETHLALTMCNALG